MGLSIFVEMQKRQEDIERVVIQWIESSEKDYISMKKVFLSKDYSMALFLGHQVIEKLLNACYFKIHQIHALHIHNLVKLAREIDPELTESIKDELKGISIFNLSLHCDNYKQEFIKMCTPEFSEFWLGKIENVRQWIFSKLN